MTDYMVEGLVKKRAAVAGEIKAAQAILVQMAYDLETLDNAIRLVAPDLRIPASPPNATPREEKVVRVRE